MKRTSHCRKTQEKEPFWAFLSSSWLQKIKITKEGALLGFFIFQLDAENQNNQRGNHLTTGKKLSGKKSQTAETTSETKPSALSSNEKRFKNYGTQR